jgi:hypothetical protein
MGGNPSVFRWHRTNERLRRNASGMVWQQRSAAPRLTRMQRLAFPMMSRRQYRIVAVE